MIGSRYGNGETRAVATAIKQHVVYLIYDYTIIRALHAQFVAKEFFPQYISLKILLDAIYNTLLIILLLLFLVTVLCPFVTIF